MTTPTPGPDVRHCIKCGREVGTDDSICAICNRAGMATPSPTQYHGTIVVAIVVAVAALAFAASASLEGVGPYRAAVRDVSAADPGYAILYAVTNDGTRPGRAKCQLAALTDTGRALRSVNTLTDRIEGGASVEALAEIPGLEERPASVRISCS